MISSAYFYFYFIFFYENVEISVQFSLLLPIFAERVMSKILFYEKSPLSPFLPKKPFLNIE